MLRDILENQAEMLERIGRVEGQLEVLIEDAASNRNLAE